MVLPQMKYLLDTMQDAKEYGSILNVEQLDWALLREFVGSAEFRGQMSFDTVGLEETQERLRRLVEIAAVMAEKYDVVVTNPPYMGGSGMGDKLSEYVKKYYASAKSDLFACFIEKSLKITLPNGYTSIITMHSWMFLASFDKMREYIVHNIRISNILHLGMEAFDDIIGKVVSTVAIVFNSRVINSYRIKAVRLVDFYDSNRHLKK